MHTFRIHHNLKIHTACFEESKRPLHHRDSRPDEAHAMRGHGAPCRIKTGRSFHVVGRRSRRHEPTLARSTACWISQGLATASPVLDRHTEQDDAPTTMPTNDNEDGDQMQNQPSRGWCSVHDKGSSFGTLAEESAAGWLPFKIAAVTSGERNASRRA
jgi:hypothetical protein